MKSERGFTLIEALIVVAIVGIILAIAIPNIMQAVERGKQKAAMAPTWQITCGEVVHFSRKEPWLYEGSYSFRNQDDLKVRAPIASCQVEEIARVEEEQAEVRDYEPTPPEEISLPGGG